MNVVWKSRLPGKADFELYLSGPDAKEAISPKRWIALKGAHFFAEFFAAKWI